MGEKYWQLTITAHGDGKSYPTCAAVIAVAKPLNADGVRKIDVGCMQINLRYDSRRLKAPRRHAIPAPAALLLSRLRKVHRSLTRTVACQHYSSRESILSEKHNLVRLWIKRAQTPPLEST